MSKRIIEYDLDTCNKQSLQSIKESLVDMLKEVNQRLIREEIKEAKEDPNRQIFFGDF